MDKEFPNRFLLHRCSCDGHYHLILSEDEKTVSWPFWSKEAGLKLVPFTRDMLVDEKTLLEDVQFIDSELGRIRQEIVAASKIQNCTSNGRFVKGFQMPTHIQPREGPISHHWLQFRTGKTDHAVFTSCGLTGNWTHPLYCEFVRRSEPRLNKAPTHREALELAQKPAQIATMVELGITLELAA